MKDVTKLRYYELLLYNDYFKDLNKEEGFRDYYMKYPDKFKDVNLRALPKMLRDKIQGELEDNSLDVIMAFFDNDKFNLHDDMIKFLLSLNRVELGELITTLSSSPDYYGLQTYLLLLDKYISVPLLYLFAQYINRATGFNSNVVRDLLNKHFCTNRLAALPNANLLGISAGLIADFVTAPVDANKEWDPIMSSWI